MDNVPDGTSWPLSASDAVRAALAAVPGVTDALTMVMATARQSQPGMLVGLSPREGAFVTLFAVLACWRGQPAYGAKRRANVRKKGAAN